MDKQKTPDLKKKQIVKTICSKCNRVIDITEQGVMMYNEGKLQAQKETAEKVLEEIDKEFLKYNAKRNKIEWNICNRIKKSISKIFGSFT